MVKKEKKTPIEGSDNWFVVEDYYEDEPITKNILSSVNDFYNLLHLIRKSWPGRKYCLKMEDAGYNIYEDEDLTAWIGIKEKCDSIMFIICGGTLYEKAYKDLKGPMAVFDFDEDLWVYSELQISDVIKETRVEKQRKTIKNWINREIKKIL